MSLATKPGILTIDKIIFTHGNLIINARPQAFNQKGAEYNQGPVFTHQIDEPPPDFNLYSEDHWNEMR